MKRILLIVGLISGLWLQGQCYESVHLGGGHTVALKSDGTLWGWGRADAGQLHSSVTREYIPKQLGTASDWYSVFCGGLNTFAIKNNGTLWGTGSNNYGCLGGNSTTQVFSTFQQIGTDTNWTKVAASANFTIGLKTDGTVWGWGQNDYFQLGQGSSSAQQLFPLQIGTATDWVDIAVSTDATGFALKSDGTLWGWGFNPSSLLSYGNSNISEVVPIQITTVNTWVKMRVGGSHILAQKADGTLWAWGGGEHAIGQGGAVIVTNTPQPLGTGIWKDFAAGPAESIGIKSDGTLWVWGINDLGQLGDGTTTNRNVPTQIGTANDWETVQYSLSFHTMLTKTDGTIWYWGPNNYYATYGGNTVVSTVAVQMPNVCVGPTLSSEDFTAANSIALYPNPSKWMVTLDYQLETAAQLQVIDVSGRVVLERELAAAETSFQFETTAMASGVYAVQVLGKDGGVWRSKLIVE
ncbi:T9SS type A sorting domain-containing protein [Flavobacterium chuncheonense]|uniref:T9SS type A sorting domain-containing protein n=1 Tax=Flavobacterium chuncheonense TaxID=2026653 RepID=A0ABW5YJW5_9FLAO